MTGKYRPVRRVVTGNDERGRSRVLFDSDAPNVHPRPHSPGTYFFEMWTIGNAPAVIAGDRDASPAGQALDHSPPGSGAHWRLVHSPGKQATLDAEAARESHAAMNRTGASELKEGGRHWNLHRTPTVDYAFCVAGERHLVLDRADVPVRRGDVVVQLGNWHAWDNRSDVDVGMSYVMIGGEFAS